MIAPHRLLPAIAALGLLPLAPMPAAAGADLLATPPSARTKGMMQFIGSLEGPGGYDDYYRGAPPPPKPLTSMTVREVLAWQSRISGRSQSTAAGRYQIIQKTLGKLVRDLGLTGSELFDAKLQNLMARKLMVDAGWDPDAPPSDSMANGLAHIWAALPLVSGEKQGLSAYNGIAGNRALTTPRIFRKVLASAGDPKAVNAAIAASGSAPLAQPDPVASVPIVMASADQSASTLDAPPPKMAPPRAFDASVIEGGTLAPSRVIVFKNDPFEVN